MDSKVIGKRLAELRGKRTQQQVSDATGISISAIGMYEIGARIPSDENKIKLAKYFHKSVQHIFFN